ncbi:MAG: hypothetical protein GX793_06820 [Bacteroidales bacterium]|jgi:hypothetical protein|nr:hypothetical protein [Bacteroidales bacterium]MCK9497931.1 hypothetical protein [Bacteroidales bacterium]MDY0314596.1 hypothetical protein [Bacteroidales bacterium]NLB86756.1 hypothetical protein [Bacteroidales bacterium]
MSKFWMIIYFISFISILNAQKPCVNNFDSVSVLEFAKQKNLVYKIKGLSDEEIAKTPSYQPKLNFDANTCVWTIKSVKYSNTNFGKCRKTNGCTIEKSLIVKIDAEKKKIVAKKRRKRKIPNYE